MSLNFVSAPVSRFDIISDNKIRSRSRQRNERTIASELKIIVKPRGSVSVNADDVVNDSREKSAVRMLIYTAAHCNDDNSLFRRKNIIERIIYQQMRFHSSL